jgi:hypothetical protein
MRGKKVINNNQIVQNIHHKVDINKLHTKKRVLEVKSLEPKTKYFALLPQTQNTIKPPH